MCDHVLGWMGSCVYLAFFGMILSFLEFSRLDWPSQEPLGFACLSSEACLTRTVHTICLFTYGFWVLNYAYKESTLTSESSSIPDKFSSTFPFISQFSDCVICLFEYVLCANLHGYCYFIASCCASRQVWEQVPSCYFLFRLFALLHLFCPLPSQFSWLNVEIGVCDHCRGLNENVFRCATVWILGPSWWCRLRRYNRYSLAFMVIDRLCMAKFSPTSGFLSLGFVLAFLPVSRHSLFLLPLLHFSIMDW